MQRAITRAEEARARGDVVAELRDLTLFVALVAEEAVSTPTGDEVLAGYALEAPLSRIWEILKGGQVAPSELPDLQTSAHIAAVLGLRELSLGILEHPRTDTPFWEEYRRGLVAFAQGDEFSPDPKVIARAKGELRYYLPFLAYFAGTATIAAIDSAFEKRSKDKRLVSYGFDGDGGTPASWHLRKFAILALRAR
ncbi:MAG: hypothetical protein H6716_06475 [Polyangiaceae bacterium]|nr:hypothetical protein [Polyangiaceae bacterium]